MTPFERALEGELEGSHGDRFIVCDDHNHREGYTTMRDSTNWAHTELGRDWDIYTDEHGMVVGQQYLTGTGPLNILAQSKDGTELLVVELKRGRLDDVVVGQVLRYMGYVAELEPAKIVRGVVIGLEDSVKLRRALQLVPNVTYMRYEVNFRLMEG